MVMVEKVEEGNRMGLEGIVISEEAAISFVGTKMS